MENRNVLIVDAEFTHATGTAERDAALSMLDRRKRRRRITLGADKAYDVAAFVYALRGRKVTPHIAVAGHATKTGKRRKTRIDGRTTRHLGYIASQRIRKRLEESFGWIKTSAGFAKTPHRGIERAGWKFMLTAAACNLVRTDPDSRIMPVSDGGFEQRYNVQADLQLGRTPRPLPRLRINTEIGDLAGFRYEDFALEGYTPHPHIAAPVAV